MSDLISRQDAIDAVYERIKQIGYENSLPILSIGQAIRDLPSAQPKTGKWEKHIFDGIMGSRPSAWMCDQCNSINIVKTDYCPNCGARMLNGGEDDV